MFEHCLGRDLVTDGCRLQVIDLHPHANGGLAGRKAVADRSDGGPLAELDDARGRENRHDARVMFDRRVGVGHRDPRLAAQADVDRVLHPAEDRSPGRTSLNSRSLGCTT